MLFHALLLHSIRKSDSSVDQKQVEECVEQLDDVISDSRSTEDERAISEDLRQKLLQFLSVSRSMEVPFVSAPVGTPGLEDSSHQVVEMDDGKPKCLVFHDSQRALVKHLELDKEIDEKSLVLGDLLLGEGMFGRVYNGTYCGVPVAIKELHPDATPESVQSFVMEGKALRNLHHPFICEYMGHTENPFRVVTRMYPRNLADAVDERDLHGRPVLILEDKFRVSYQLSAALLYLHKNGILHRDIKLPNIMLDHNNDVKVADFGLSMFAPGMVYDDGDPPGSPLYMAPEVLTRHAFTDKCEVYTFGLMLYEIFTGRTAFADVKTVGELKERQKVPDPLPLTEADYSQKYGDGRPPKEFWDFAKTCWKYFPDERPTMEEVVSRIVAIGVHTAIPRSRTTEDFWLKCSSFVYRDRLFLMEFIARCTMVNGNKLQKLMKEVLPQGRDYLTITEYWNMCCWFPNFFINPSSLELMESVVYSQWFALNETEVKARLEIAPIGTFVIRPSTSNPFAAPFTVCLKETSGLVHHHVSRRICKNQLCFTVDTLIDGDPFSDIFEIVKCLIQDLRFTPAKPRNPASLDTYYPSMDDLSGSDN